MNDLYGPLDEKRKKRKKAGTESSKESSLRDWFGRKGAKGKKKGWVDCNAPDGKGGYKSCGRSGGERRKKYPACRPTPGACKERGKGKSWGKKAKSKKSRKNEEISMELEQIILEELEAVLDEKKKRKKKKKKKSGKKDACYHKVKSRYKVWPSAYASGALVKCRKVGAKNWGNSKKESLQIIIEDELMQVLSETHSAKHEKELEKISDELAGASKMHKGQSDRIKKILAQTEDPEKDKAEEENLDERCQKGYKTHETRKTKKMYGKTYRNCVPKESKEPVEEENELYEMKNCGCGQDPCKTYGNENKITVKLNKIVEEELQAVLDEKKKKKKPCKPSKGKRFAKRVNGKCRSFGQKGQAKGGGDRIRPGTKKGDAYCARSAKIKKCKNPPCANDLSRKKWKCRGSKSMKE
jgi:hypothetical protein